ncbi:hypothetical protein [Synechococcus sp. CS-1328]|nr:hypothetical protein [Synechococcus sp. CS-1328]MCT0224784.1 hypothetical protein [Synechococcus sp. CS-1328]
MVTALGVTVYRFAETCGYMQSLSRSAAAAIELIGPLNGYWRPCFA